MSVKKDDINLNNILDKAVGKTGPEPKKKGTTKTEPELASILDAAATGSLKKKRYAENICAFFRRLCGWRCTWYNIYDNPGAKVGGQPVELHEGH